MHVRIIELSAARLKKLVMIEEKLLEKILSNTFICLILSNLKLCKKMYEKDNTTLPQQEVTYNPMKRN